MNMKKYFELGMLKQLENKGIDEITVSELIEDVGSCKGTFYKYYVDKYDLCCACIKNHVYCNVSLSVQPWEDFILQCFAAFENISKIIVHAFESVDVNSVRHYHERLLTEYLTAQYIKKGGDVSSNINVTAVSMWASSITDITYNWLKGGKKEDKEEIISVLRAVMPQAISAQLLS